MPPDPAPPLTVDLWSMRTPDFQVEHRLAVLDDGERERADRFLHARDRRDYVAAHVLARHLLAHLGAGRPAELAFHPDGNGKPRLVPAAGHREICFNLTHTDGLVAVAATDGINVGIDAEAIDRRLVDDDVARTVFTADEMATLDGLDGAVRRYAFFRLWTLKEAAVKMLGTGLSTPLDAVQIVGDPPRLEFLNGRHGTAADWHLRIEQPTVRHLLALAVACGSRSVAVRRRIVDAHELDANETEVLGTA